MRNIFKVVAKETLVDDAAKVNENQNTTDPAANQSAVDFDAELKKLTEEQQATDQSTPPADNANAGDPTPDQQTDAPKPDEQTDQNTDSGKPAEADKSDENGGDKGGEKSDKPSEDPADEEDTDPAEAAEPVPTDADLQKATEAINRLSRCYESIQEAHATGVISPEAVAIANNEVDAVLSDLNIELPPAPAIEALRSSTESGRFSELSARVVQAIKAAWAKFMEWIGKIVQWLRNFKRAYQARKGIYDKTAEGYRRRLRALGGQLPLESAKNATVVLDDINLGPLKHNLSKKGIEGIIQSVTLLSTTALKVGKIVTGVDNTSFVKSMTDVVSGLSKEPMRDLAARIEGFDIPKELKATAASNAIVVNSPDLTSEFKQSNGKDPGVVAVGGVPGGLTLKWTFGEHSYFADMADAVHEISKVGFTTVTASSDEESDNESLTLDTSTVEKLLDLQKNMSNNLGFLINVTSKAENEFNLMLTTSKKMTAVLEDYAKQADHPATDIQDVLHVYSLIANSYEKAFIRPMNEMTRVLSRGEEKLLQIAGNGLAAIDQQLKKPA